MKTDLNYNKYVYFWLLLSLMMAFLLCSHLLEIFPKTVVRWFVEPSILKSSYSADPKLPFFYLVFAGEMLFVGILLDKLGMRVAIGLLVMICLFATYFFADVNSNTTAFLIFSRILIGGGAALVGIGYIKVVAGMMPPNRFALMAGILTSVALLGVTFGDVPAVQGWLHYTWQQTVIAAAAVIVIFIILFSLLLRDSRQTINLPAWKDLRLVLRNPQNWLLAVYSGLAFAPLAILTVMAGKPFFAESYQYTHQQIVELGMFLLSGFTLGAPTVGFLASKLKRCRPIMLVSILVQEMIFIPLIYLNQMPYWLNAILLLLFGFASSAFILSMAIGKEINPLTVVGTIMSLMKIGVLIVSALTEQLFGKFLDWAWDGKMISGVPYFSVSDYHAAFFIFPVYLLLGFILLLFVDEPIFW